VSGWNVGGDRGDDIWGWEKARQISLFPDSPSSGRAILIGGWCKNNPLEDFKEV